MRQKLALTKLFWKNADFAKKILFNHGRKRGKNAYDVDGTKTSTIFVIFYKVPSLSLLWNKGHLFTKIWSKSVVHLYYNWWKYDYKQETLNFTWKCGNLLLFYPNIPWKIINNFLRLPNNEKTSLWKMNMLCGYARFVISVTG